MARTSDDLTAGVALLNIELIALGVSQPDMEHRFHPKRRWRFDWAWPARHLAVEFEGGTFVHGRHTTGAGFERDCQKYNVAAVLGWTVLRFTRAMVDSGEALETILAAFGRDAA